MNERKEEIGGCCWLKEKGCWKKSFVTAKQAWKALFYSIFSPYLLWCVWNPKKMNERKRRKWRKFFYSVWNSMLGIKKNNKKSVINFIKENDDLIFFFKNRRKVFLSLSKNSLKNETLASSLSPLSSPPTSSPSSTAVSTSLHGHLAELAPPSCRASINV